MLRDKLLTVRELAKYTRKHPVTIYKSRDIPGRLKIGGAVRFRESVIKQWLRDAERGGEKAE